MFLPVNTTHRTETAPDFRDEEITSFVEIFFNKGRQFIHTMGSRLTPCYLFEPAVITDRAEKFKRAFQSHLPDTGFYYAMKSNNFPDVSGTILKSDFGLDVSSGVELELALELGATNIVFSGPGKTETELDMAVMNNDKVVVLMDSLTELKRLEERAARINKKIRTGVRLTTEPTGLWKKFGILPENLNKFIQAAKACPHIRFQGLQFHSSWNMAPEKQVKFIEKLGQILGALPERHRGMIRFIDIGGGYWPEQGEWILETQEMEKQRNGRGKAIRINPSTPIEHFAEEISQALFLHIHNQINCRIYFEPGRWISNDAMHIIIKVMDKKYDNLVITDAGINAVGWERFETDYFPVLNLSQPAMTEKDCLILGSLCTPHDVWGYRYWGEDIKEGDLLMIPTQGAYTYSLGQAFIKAVPPVLSFP
ncbi:diaminopimelate decarboxylase [Desulfocicer vacuolatum DSM 3385]|uniref:Diaminopimelate decarboxylase n=1 Tax=Desulfocicer vacuolatum DSM 3385 TaxID=1121400 RepID=A0A1W2AYH5_9BACT|nr:alanine racemase [Desulfocicer vacuolatum]SMC65743.1 diaminopimelate decarboxylase [Desulfocicer vacuolatum DSM 3385]